MDLESQKNEALRLFRIWMAQEKICAKYIADEPINDLMRLRNAPQSIWEDYQNRNTAELAFGEFIKEYPESW